MDLLKKKLFAAILSYSTIKKNLVGGRYTYQHRRTASWPLQPRCVVCILALTGLYQRRIVPSP